jgi:hypothetical protein
VHPKNKNDENNQKKKKRVPDDVPRERIRRDSLLHVFLRGHRLPHFALGRGHPMTNKPLTDAAVRKFTAGAKRRRIPDAGMRSLFLVIEPSGRKSFQMRFRTPAGRIGKVTLGPYALGDEIKGEPQIGQPLPLASR